jgi:hypothetical protein
MRDVLKYLLIGVGGYLLIRQIFGHHETAVSAPPEPTPSPVPGPDTKRLVLEAAQKAGNGDNPMLTFDQWNYYYEQVRGAHGPAIEDAMPGVDRNFRMTVDEWWAAVQKVGLRGVPIFARWVW